MSEGEFDRHRPINPAKKTPQDTDESSDTYDTIDWLLKNVPNHNGNVGLYGMSFRGYLVAAGMIDAHPALKAASPQAPIVDWFMGDDWRHNGALFLNHAFHYMPNLGKPRPGLVKEPLFSKFDYGTPDGYDFFLRLGLLSNVDAKHYKGQVPFWNDLMTHGTYDAFWKARNLRPHLKNIKPAVLTVGGWYDAENLFGVMETYHRLEADRPGSDRFFVMGPWIHGGWNYGEGSSLGAVGFGSKTAEFFRESIEKPFFDFYLKGKGDHKQPKVRAFETGTNQWREYPSWPPKGTEPLEFYLHANGRLGSEKPKDQEIAFDEYVSDPAKPVPFTDQITTLMIPEYMIGDQRFASTRPDVLVYEGEVLAKDLTLAGPLAVQLHVSTTGTDSDWIVKLIDVYPGVYPDPIPNPRGVRMGGYQQLVRGEVMRGRFRKSFETPEPFVPGKPTPVSFQLLDVYHTFRKGHKLMVQVHSSWFPLVDRNPQTFVDIFHAKESDFQKATQRVYRSREMFSRIVANKLP